MMNQREQKFRNWKNTKFASMAWILCVLILVIAILLNMILSRLDLNWDISPNQQYSLSNTTEDYLKQLDADNVTVDLYVLATEEDMESDLEALVIYRAFKSYDAHESVQVHWVDPDRDTETLEMLNPDNAYTLNTGDMIFVCGEYQRRLPGTEMSTTTYDDNGYVVSEEFHGENLITGAIKSVVEGFMPTVYFLTGHGEKSLEKYSRFQINLKNNNYAAKELDLSEAAAVPDDAAFLLIAAPTSDITTAEMEKINTYLENGGNITLMMSPNEGAFAYTNLESIMEDYGLYMDYDRVYETNSAYHLSGDNTTVQCELQEVDDDSEAADLTSALMDQGLYTFMPASRSFRYDSQGGLYTIAPLITTYDSAVGEPYGGISDDPETLEGSSLMLAASSENNERNGSKMVVFGNAEFIDDEHVSSDTVIIPVYLFLSAISWMYGSDLDMGIASKSTSNDYIALQDATFAQSLMVVYTIIPIAIMAVGIGIWVKRRNS